MGSGRTFVYTLRRSGGPHVSDRLLGPMCVCIGSGEAVRSCGMVWCALPSVDARLSALP